MPENPVTFSPSNTATELKLIEIWKDVLQAETLTVHDRFIDLGGDSLAAMLCISRIRTAFGIELGIEDLLGDQATISEFATVIDQSGSEAG
jgi:acyl carrier protein